MLVGDVFRPFVNVLMRGKIPCLFKHKFIHEGVTVKSFECRTDASEVLSAIDECVFDAFVDFTDISCQHCFSTEIAKITPDIRYTIILVCLLPDFLSLAIVIQQQLLFSRVGGDVRLNSVVRPIFAFVPEEPSHLQPHRILISGT